MGQETTKQQKEGRQIPRVPPAAPRRRCRPLPLEERSHPFDMRLLALEAPLVPFPYSLPLLCIYPSSASSYPHPLLSPCSPGRRQTDGMDRGQETT